MSGDDVQRVRGLKKKGGERGVVSGWGCLVR